MKDIEKKASLIPSVEARALSLSPMNTQHEFQKVCVTFPRALSFSMKPTSFETSTRRRKIRVYLCFAKALAGRQKLLLKATPLQKNLMELFGLVSIIDDNCFGSETAFQSEFAGREGRASQALLAKRLEPICKRTLRRQVQHAGLINYTNRLPKTFDFTPGKLETDLYEKVSAYLQNPKTIALGQKILRRGICCPHRRDRAAD